ncbi:MAG: hypothetical protein SFX18_17770 [Pirellulales bacterium]|nr:hypothetical protein [Pirellulales bacterium]
MWATWTDYTHDRYRDLWIWINSLNRQEWLMMGIATLVLGAIMLRGFGSRKNY